MRNRVQRTRAPSSCQWIFHGIEVKWCRKSSHLYLYATASDLIIADTRLDFSINATTNHPSILSIVNRVRISHSNVSTTIYFSFPTKLLLYLREIKILSVPIYWIYFFAISFINPSKAWWIVLRDFSLRKSIFVHSQFSLKSNILFVDWLSFKIDFRKWFYEITIMFIPRMWIPNSLWLIVL